MQGIIYVFFAFCFILSANAQVISKIAFGSCINQNKRAPLFRDVLANDPDVFIFLGDNIYGDSESIEVLKHKYDKLASKPEFQALKDSCTVLATWDDHDFGVNDGGREYPSKEESRSLFFDFWNTPANAERRKHNGVYDAPIFGKDGKKVQIILLDTRYFRDPLLDGEGLLNFHKPNASDTVTLLGDEQWKWLKEQLLKPADIRIVASSIQFDTPGNGFEAWANFPHDKQKILSIIKQTKANGIVFISGDVHWGELSRWENQSVYPLYDVTASSINKQCWVVKDNPTRLGKATRKNNYGMISINWETAPPSILLQVFNKKNKVVCEHKTTLDEISFGDVAK